MGAVLFPSPLWRARSVSLVRHNSMSSCKVGRVELRGRVSVALRDPLELAEVEEPLTPPLAQNEVIVVPAAIGLELFDGLHDVADDDDKGLLVLAPPLVSLPQALDAAARPLDPAANRSCNADIFCMYWMYISEQRNEG